MKNFFNRNNKQTASDAYVPPTKPSDIADLVRDPYKYMNEEHARELALTAALEDKVGDLAGIARYHTTCANWIIYPNGSIGSERMQVPLMHYAAGEGNLQALRWLIDNGADLEARSNLLNQTALYFAVQRGQIDAAKMLLDAGADPFTRAEVPNPMDLMTVAADKDFNTPEMAALIRRYQGETADSMQTRTPQVIKGFDITQMRKRGS